MDIAQAVIISTGFTFKVQANRLLYMLCGNTICSLNLDNSLILCKPIESVCILFNGMEKYVGRLNYTTRKYNTKNLPISNIHLRIRIMYRRHETMEKNLIINSRSM